MKVLMMMVVLLLSTIGFSDSRYVTRVLYSETSIVNEYERYLVYSVIKNRIGHKGFNQGKLKSLYEVVTQKGAFVCIDDPKNSNWLASSNKLTNKAWDNSYTLVTSNRDSYPDIVYYHDKSITMPKVWNNKWWKPVLVEVTEHFMFYKVISK